MRYMYLLKNIILFNFLVRILMFNRIKAIDKDSLTELKKLRIL